MNIKQIIKIILGITIISISAQLTIDVGDIPITGQTLAILILAFFNHPKDMFIISFAYVSLGLLGLPILADGASGFSKLTGGSGGFLIGFIVSSTIISFLYQYQKSKNWSSILLLTGLGTILILFLGVGRLTLLYGIEKGIEYGFTPFWKGAILKVIIGSFITVLIHNQLKSKRSSLNSD